MLFDHRIDWEESTVLKHVNSYRRQLIAESWFMNAHTCVPSNFMANRQVPKFSLNNCTQNSKKTFVRP